MNADSGYAVEFNEKKCRYHGRCAEVCPVDAITVDKEKRAFEYDKDACIGCGLCAEHCPEKALSLYVDHTKPMPLDIDLVRKEFADA